VGPVTPLAWRLLALMASALLLVDAPSTQIAMILKCALKTTARFLLPVHLLRIAKENLVTSIAFKASVHQPRLVRLMWSVTPIFILAEFVSLALVPSLAAITVWLAHSASLPPLKIVPLSVVCVPLQA